MQGSRMRGHIVAAALLSFIVLLAACGGDDSSSKDSSSSTTVAGTSSTTAAASTATTASSGGSTASGNTPDPCSLITDAEATAILGGTVTRGSATSAFRGHDCKWTNAATAGNVLVQVYKGRAFYNPSVHGKTSDLSGVGDEAFVTASGTTTVTVGIRKGDTVVFITGFYVKSADAVTAAAKDAASKM
jgi:hypothetical protein